MRHMAEYLEDRCAAGYDTREPGKLLRSFIAHCRRAGSKVITGDLAIAWASIGTSRRARIRRLRAVRALALFARLEDGRHELPPAEHFGRDRPMRPAPYILTDGEVAALIRGARDGDASGAISPWVLETLLGLLACTGVRIGEALALRCSDVTPTGLLIRLSKRGRGRLLPLHRTAQHALNDYLRWRSRQAAFSDHLFVGPRGTQLKYDCANDALRRLRVVVGVEHRVGRRLGFHALRHAFAVRALKCGPSGRDAVGVHMKAVSEYLGHAMLVDTYWYYEATPDLLLDVMKECERHEAPL
jgi:integrase/recombinase XerD